MAAYDTFYVESLCVYHIPLPRKVLIRFGRIFIFCSAKKADHWWLKMWFSHMFLVKLKIGFFFKA